MHKKWIKGIWCAAMVGALSAGAVQRQPNVIMIYTDDHGYADLSCQGVFDDVRTPNIDRLAEGGVRMTDGYCTAPQCVPSRGGLISGQYQNKFGLESNPQFNDAKTMKRFEEYIAPNGRCGESMGKTLKGSGSRSRYSIISSDCL